MWVLGMEASPGDWQQEAGVSSLLDPKAAPRLSAGYAETGCWVTSLLGSTQPMQLCGDY